MNNLEEALRSNFLYKKDVVYLMTEIGKVLEKTRDNKSFPTLSFYRNWSVHNKINDLKEFKDFFEEIDNTVKGYLGFKFDKTREMQNNITDFFSFQKLKKELFDFLKICNLPIYNIEYYWDSFTSNLRELLLDIPIEINDIPQSIPNSKIRVFRITRNPMFVPGNLVGIAWEIWMDTSEVPMTGYLEDTLEERID